MQQKISTGLPKNLLHQVFQIQEILDTLNLLDGRAIGLYREFESAVRWRVLIFTGNSKDATYILWICDTMRCIE